MGLDFEYKPGETPLDEDEKEGLIPDISTRGELDEYEQQNIETAVLYYWGRRISVEKFFTEKFIKEVHRRMYGDVWRWAGSFRKTNKNIGVDKWRIPIELKYLLDDGRYWVEHLTYEPEEITIRFKHRLVSIHCFPNGNGRHSRLIADIMMQRLFLYHPFTWGAANLVKAGNERQNYLAALKDADKGNMIPLIQFANS